MNRKIFVLIAILNFAFNSQMFSQNLTKTDYTNEEIFGKEVFKAIKTNNYSMLEKFLPTRDDFLEYIENIAENNPDISESEIKEAKTKFNEFKQERINVAKRDFNSIRKIGIDRGIEWNKTSIKTIEYEVIKEKGVVEGDIYLVFNFEETQCTIKLNNCLKVSRTWLLGEDIDFEECQQVKPIRQKSSLKNISGKYIKETEEETGTLTIEYVNETEFKFKVSVGSENCSGQFPDINDEFKKAKITGNKGVYDENGIMFSFTFDFNTKTIIVEENEKASEFHGFQCEFSGTYKKQ